MKKLKYIILVLVFVLVGVVHAEDENIDYLNINDFDSTENNDVINDNNNDEEFQNNIEPEENDFNDNIELYTSIIFKSHIQNLGWEDEWKNSEEVSGTIGQRLRMESIKISLNNQEYSGNIEYQSHIESIGWETNWKKNGEISGTTGRGLRLEALRIKLTGEISEHYDIYYRVHSEHFGWLGWAKNGEEAGTSGYGYRLEAYQIILVAKGEDGPNSDVDAYKYPKTLSQSHIQSIGWQSVVYDDQISGTIGQRLRMESIKILLNNQEYSGNIEYQSHIESIGWEANWKKNGEISGTTGRGLRLEALRIKLIGEISEHYDIYYRVHSEHFGWLGWAKNGEEAGTSGYGYRLEAYQIILVAKGEEGPNSDVDAYKYPKTLSQSHIQSIGWQSVVYDDQISGTIGQRLRMESIKILLNNQEYSGNIEYQSHIESIGWEANWKKNGEISGTTGRGLRLEALRIKLTGEISEHYDIYYRVHSEHFGWLGWAKNGEEAGTSGYGYRLEAYQIILVAKGEEGPNSDVDAYKYGWHIVNNQKYYIFPNGVRATGIQKIGDTRYMFSPDGVLMYSDVKVYIDISSHQGNIDFDALYNSGQIDGVILRIGYWTSEDPYFKYYIADIKRLNIPYTVYLYSYAHNSAEALQEAQTMLSLYTKYQLNPAMNVYYDVEGYKTNIENSDDITQEGYQGIVETFIGHLNSNGVGARLYSYYWFALNRFNAKTREYLDWIAQYTDTNTYPYSWRGWQYTSSGRIAGINTDVDLSIFLF